jgi:hypothetical protein
MGEKANELLRYRSKVFHNMMSERIPVDQIHERSNKCVLNHAVFDGKGIIYSAVVNALDKDDNFVDLKLSLNRKSRREHLEKMQRLWSIAVLKPSTRIILGIRSGKSKDPNAVPDGRLVRVEEINLNKLPQEVIEFSHKAQYDAPLWQPKVSFDFLKRVIDYLDNRVMDDARTVYQLVPEGFYGRGFSLLSIHKLNLKGCDPLIPEWYVQDEDGLTNGHNGHHHDHHVNGDGNDQSCDPETSCSSDHPSDEIEIGSIASGGSSSGASFAD